VTEVNMHNIKRVSDLYKWKKHLFFLVVGIFPVRQMTVLEHAPSAVPSSKATDVLKHCLTHMHSCTASHV